LPAGGKFAFVWDRLDMSLASFVQAHAANADWRVALAQSQRQIQTQIAAGAAQQGDSVPFTLGWCYLSDYYAPAAEAILDELRPRSPGVAWVGTIGVGVAASGIEYIDEPALVLMVAPLLRASGIQRTPDALHSTTTRHGGFALGRLLWTFANGFLPCAPPLDVG
jgi:hypothetical protein